MREVAIICQCLVTPVVCYKKSFLSTAYNNLSLCPLMQAMSSDTGNILGQFSGQNCLWGWKCPYAGDKSFDTEVAACLIRLSGSMVFLVDVPYISKT